MRSERTPARTPPMAEALSVTVASAPVAPLPTPNVVPIAVSVSVRMMRSKASSEKPAKAALYALRRRGPRSCHQEPVPPSRRTGLTGYLRVAVGSGGEIIIERLPLRLPECYPTAHVLNVTEHAFAPANVALSGGLDALAPPD